MHGAVAADAVIECDWRAPGAAELDLEAPCGLVPEDKGQLLGPVLRGRERNEPGARQGIKIGANLRHYRCKPRLGKGVGAASRGCHHAVHQSAPWVIMGLPNC